MSQESDSASGIKITSVGGVLVDDTATASNGAGDGANGNDNKDGKTDDAANKGATDNTQNNNNVDKNKSTDEGADKGDAAKSGDDEIEITEDDLNPVLEEFTQGKIKSIKDIDSILEENAKLKKELETKELSFPNEQAKLLYEFAVKNSGAEYASAQNYFRVLSLDLDKTPEKEIQFEAFVVERPDLTREKARQIFDAKYEKLYGDSLETDPVLQDEHGLATRKAKETLKKFQDEYAKAGQSSKPDANAKADETFIQEYQKDVENVLDDFGGIQLAFDEGESLQFDLSQEIEQTFKEVVKNPDVLIEKIFEGCLDAKGNLDKQALCATIYEIVNRKEIFNKVREHGIELGKAAILKEAKNSSQNSGGNAGGAAPKPKPTFVEAFASAVAAR